VPDGAARYTGGEDDRHRRGAPGRRIARLAAIRRTAAGEAVRLRRDDVRPPAGRAWHPADRRPARAGDRLAQRLASRHLRFRRGGGLPEQGRPRSDRRPRDGDLRRHPAHEHARTAAMGRLVQRALAMAAAAHRDRLGDSVQGRRAALAACGRAAPPPGWPALRDAHHAGRELAVPDRAVAEPRGPDAELRSDRALEHRGEPRDGTPRMGRGRRTREGRHVPR
jgi:hypothetical protein